MNNTKDKIKLISNIIFKSLLFLLINIHITLYSQTIKDIRYCGNIKRDTNNTIIRDSKVIRDFKKLYPCPNNKKDSGACEGWAIDHIIPLACGGCDSIENMQWLPNSIKSCKEDYCKDRFERIIYSRYKENIYCK